MRTATAQSPRGGGEDRIYITPNAVILLDGASAFRPMPVRPSEYVDMLGQELTSRVASSADLRTVLRDAIKVTAGQLKLTRGHSPSSTVAIVRRVTDHVECLVLGDNLVVLPNQTVTDNRLSQIAPEQRARYRRRLQNGHGYDQEHRQVLKELQAEQAAHRNRKGGYWIAEADPVAAEHSILTRHPSDSVPWAILASDGAYKPMIHLGLADWPNLKSANGSDLEIILDECHRWESNDDPNGIRCPRAKRHDDKTLAVTTFPVEESGLREGGVVAADGLEEADGDHVGEDG